MKPKPQDEQYPSSEAGQLAKAQSNRAMFDRIAYRYDRLNRLMSLGMDGVWRRRLVEMCEIVPGDRCLDLCCGTGAVAQELAHHGATVVGIDASANMLAVARRRTGKQIHLVQGDALRLPCADGTFDAITIAFGNRNVASLERLYAEMRRVAKPGGRVVSLEISRPASRLLSRAFMLYFGHFPAFLARLMGADPAAYAYLPESVRRYPPADDVAEIMRSVGLRDVSYARFMGGVIVIHRGIA